MHVGHVDTRVSISHPTILRFRLWSTFKISVVRGACGVNRSASVDKNVPFANVLANNIESITTMAQHTNVHAIADDGEKIVDKILA